MSIYGGEQSIEDVREIREDESLREAVQLEDIPSSSAIGDWLKREAERGGIEAQKRDAKMTYLGVKGYRPVVATLKETAGSDLL